MIIARNTLLIFVALLLQASWVDTIAIFGITPDVVIIVLVFVGITRGQIEATILGFISGLLIDIYNPGAGLGINALANSLVGFGVGYSRVGVVAEDTQVQAAILFAATLLHDIIFFVFSLDPIKILSVGLSTAVYTTVLGIAFAFALTRFLSLRIEPHA